MVSNYDVVIVGAGILGISTAYHLKNNNPDLSVMVVDQFNQGGMGNTSKSAALFRNVFTSPVNRLLSSASINFYRYLQTESGIDLGLRYTGYLWMCDESLWKQFEIIRMKEKQFANQTSLPELKFELDDIDADMLRNQFGCDTYAKVITVEGNKTMPLPAVEHSIIAPACGIISPAKLVSYYENEFKNMGGEVLYRTKVEKIQWDRSLETGNEHVVNGNGTGSSSGLENNLHFTGLGTSDGLIRADRICLATGTWTNFLTDPVGIDVHIKPKKRQLFNIVIPPENLPEGFENRPERFPIIVIPPDGIFLKPLRLRGNFVVGWADDLGRAFEFEEEPKAEPGFFTNYIHPIVSAYLPWMQAAELKHSWAGQYHYNTLDGNPFIFNIRNLTVVAGASGSGIMKADAIGKLTAARIEGKTTPEIMKDAEFPLDALGIESRLVQKEQLII